ncbi:hypothetical protein DFH07DRAFT_773780 [Mycena maculata]|uniref:Uncharacterized protein n=1 Tax=Mycena maculata TaxID=230809 RepID=A0AAD7J0C3_9AGAR|nr:hypothetical protein DFH07DRAFT_773780 [Mycena maculata]
MSIGYCPLLAGCGCGPSGSRYFGCSPSSFKILAGDYDRLRGGAARWCRLVPLVRLRRFGSEKCVELPGAGWHARAKGDVYLPSGRAFISSALSPFLAGSACSGAGGSMVFCPASSGILLHGTSVWGGEGSAMRLRVADWVIHCPLSGPRTTGAAVLVSGGEKRVRSPEMGDTCAVGKGIPDRLPLLVGTGVCMCGDLTAFALTRCRISCVWARKARRRGPGSMLRLCFGVRMATLQTFDVRIGKFYTTSCAAVMTVWDFRRTLEGPFKIKKSPNTICIGTLAAIPLDLWTSTNQLQFKQ